MQQIQLEHIDHASREELTEESVGKRLAIVFREGPVESHQGLWLLWLLLLAEDNQVVVFVEDVLAEAIAMFNSFTGLVVMDFPRIVFERGNFAAYARIYLVVVEDDEAFLVLDVVRTILA